MDKWTKTMILKKIRTSGKAIISFDMFPQMFKTAGEFIRFNREHKLKFSIGREHFILRWKEKKKAKKI